VSERRDQYVAATIAWPEVRDIFHEHIQALKAADAERQRTLDQQREAIKQRLEDLMMAYDEKWNGVIREVAMLDKRLSGDIHDMDAKAMGMLQAEVRRVEAQFRASETAISKAEKSAEERFRDNAQWHQSQNERIGQCVTISAYNQRHEDLDRRVQIVERGQSSMRTQLLMVGGFITFFLTIVVVAVNLFVNFL